ncbi:MAG: GTP 3',8-cyclase MoaA [Propionibacterium sp.]|nr:GTP 3',8-cyclase MoaA [Propionibacterium sp.]
MPGVEEFPQDGNHASQQHGRKLTDRLARPLRDLRISVTDRCNFRCVYCMPREVFGRNYAFLPREDLLSFEEIERVARIAVSLGVEKLRLTGGEPLLRREIEVLIARLAALRTPAGEPLDIALTTNGAALPAKAAGLKAAGLSRITVSLDSLDDAGFQALNDVRFPVHRVLDGIAAARTAGFETVKINTVLKRSANEDQILPLAEYFRWSPHTLRFIEYMDVGSSNGWCLDEVIPSAEVVARINDHYPLEAVAPTRADQTARRWRYRDGAGEIGVISSVTGAFCGSCTRVRLSSEGKLFTCLFASSGFDLRALLRSGESDEQIAAALAGLWSRRDDRYSQLRSENTANAAARKETIHSRRRIEMSYIGG